MGVTILAHFGPFWPQPDNTPAAHSAPTRDQGRHSGPRGCVWAAGRGLHQLHSPPLLTFGLLSENSLFWGLHWPQLSTCLEYNFPQREKYTQNEPKKTVESKFGRISEIFFYLVAGRGVPPTRGGRGRGRAPVGSSRTFISAGH